MDLLSFFFGGDLDSFFVDATDNSMHIFDSNGSPEMFIEHNDFLGQDFIMAPDGNLIAQVQDGIDGSKMFMSPDGNLEFIAKNNLMGGYDLFDSTGQMIAQTLPNINPFPFKLF